MPYRVDPKNKKCVQVKKDGKWQRKGCTEGSVKKYLAALYTNVKDIKESSEEEFEWVEDILSTPPLDFVGKEIMIDIQGLNKEELEKLYKIVSPYINNSGYFINHEGEEIVWNNVDCFEGIITRGPGNNKTISLHCGIEDNGYLPLEGAICCLKQTYEEESQQFYMNIEQIVPLNGRDLIGYTIKESEEKNNFEWAEDIAKEELFNPDGSISFIPPIGTRVEVDTEDFDTGEKFTLKGEVVKTYKKGELHNDDYLGPFFTLKIDGGWQQERGWPCRHDGFPFDNNCWYVYPILVDTPDKVRILDMSKSISESEKDSELFWAEDLLKDFDKEVDITIPWAKSKEEIEESIRFLKDGLPNGSILKITGIQDGLEFHNQECKIISPSNYGGGVYLIKFPRVMYNDSDEPTHCGWTGELKKTCECQGEDERGFEVGKCWSVTLPHMEKIIYLPNLTDLTESQKEKPLLTEGRYDTITRNVVKDVMKLIPKDKIKKKVNYILPFDASGDEEYEQENLMFSVELDLIKSKDVEEFKLVSSIDYDDDENVITLTLFLGPKFGKQSLEKLFYKLQEDVRHEIEHFTQLGIYRIEDRPIYKKDPAKLKTVYGHHKNIIEVPALVRGFYRRAKLERRPLDEIMIEDLDSEIEKGLLSKKQAENLLKLWLDYAKKNLPHAIYR